VEIVTVEPKEGEAPPIAIENASLIKPFESVTEIYGFPKYKELDPTPLLAVFFILFFGFCLGDAGYGITLSLVAFFMYKKFVLSDGAKKILKLLFYGGIASTIAGILSGGWFGVDPANFPPFLKTVSNILLSMRVIDPLKNPIAMLILALGFGIVHITFGKLISFYLKWREKQYVAAICDDLLWTFFFLSLVLTGVEAAGAIKIGDIGWKLASIGAVLLVLTQGRAQKNIIMKLVSGVLSLYGTVAYLSDVLSYSRILALGLATTIIAMVINLIAEMTKGIPFVGYLIMIAILIFGHIFNIIINVLGAFIHSGRLQFVEFFSKFLEGGGKEFKPFKHQTQYVQID